MSRSIIIAIYYAVLVLALSLSTYFSFFGFLSTFESWVLVVPFVAIIALGLFAAGTLVQIGRDRKSLKEQLLAVLLFTVFAVFSSSSNFTYLYTNMRAVIERQDAIQEERVVLENAVKALESKTSIAVEGHRTTLQDLASWYARYVADELSASLSVITTTPEYLEFSGSVTTLTSELENMFEQANDPNRPGCETRCRVHASTISDMVTITDIAVPNDIGQFNQFFPGYERMVWRSFCNSNESFVALYALSNSSAPSESYCTVASSQITVNQIAEVSKGLEIFTITSVSNFLTVMNKKISDVNLILSAVPIVSTGLIQLPNLPTAIDTAGQLYSDLAKVEAPFANVSSELVLQREEFLVQLQTTLHGIRIDEPLLLGDENCASDVVNLNPRDCLQKMSLTLNGLKGQFSNLFPFDDMPDLAHQNNIAVEKGQVGTIKDTLYNGFVEVPSLPTTLFAFFMGLMIDVLPLLFAFVAFHGYVRPEAKKDIWEINA